MPTGNTRTTPTVPEWAIITLLTTTGILIRTTIMIPSGVIFTEARGVLRQKPPRFPVPVRPPKPPQQQSPPVPVGADSAVADFTSAAHDS